MTRNPVDDYWRYDLNWASDCQPLADCAIRFRQGAMGGKGGRIYVVSDSTDGDHVTPMVFLCKIWSWAKIDGLKLRFQMVVVRFYNENRKPN